MNLLPFRRRINRESVEEVLVALKNANAPEGLYVDSPGGAFECFSVLGPAIARRGIITLAGDVRSAAVILHLLGYYRLALPDATFFFHEVRTLVGPGEEEVTICDLQYVLEVQEKMQAEKREALEEWLRRMRMAQSWFLDFLARHTDVPASTFLDLMRNNATLSAQEAKRYGIVHAIISPSVVQMH